ncbi:MAG: hypothetical protein WB988_09620 [Candidatus Nitrosopolaris sp.]
MIDYDSPSKNSSSNSSISNDIFVQEIESRRDFANSLREEDRELFNKMLNDCYKHRKAINAKELSPTESLVMVLILRQGSYSCID